MSAKKPSLAASAADPEETDSNHSSTASEDETPTKPTSTTTKTKSSSGSGGSTPASSSKTRSLQTPSPKVASSGGSGSSSSSGLLTAVNKNGKTFKVKIIVNGDIFNPFSKSSSMATSSAGGSSSSSLRRRLRGTPANTTTTATLTPNNEVLVETISTPPSTPGSGGTKIPKKVKTLPAGVPLGQDGNLFHCYVCGEFGDVVCCDGCPNVYHKRCLAKDDPSRISLENDEDPWYCPSCMKGTTTGSSSSKSNKKDSSSLLNKPRSSKGQFVKKKNKNKNRDRSGSSASLSSPDGGAISTPSSATRLPIKEEHDPAAFSSPTVGGVAIKEEDSSDEDIRSPAVAATIATPISTSKKDDDDIDASPAVDAKGADDEDDDDVKQKDDKNGDAADGSAAAMDVDAAASTPTPEKVGSSPDPKLSSSKKKKKRKRNLLEEVKDSMTPPDAIDGGEGEGGDGDGTTPRRRTRSASVSLDDVVLGGRRRSTTRLSKFPPLSSLGSVMNE